IRQAIGAARSAYAADCVAEKSHLMTAALRFASLGSGSRGNSTLVEWDSGTLLIDCGFSVRETNQRLERLGKRAEDLTAILVTHEHSDHIKGVAPLARRYGLPVYMTPGTYGSRDLG